MSFLAPTHGEDAFIEDSIEILEWNALRQALHDRCETPYGQEAWKTFRWLDDRDEIIDHLREVDALQQVLQRYGQPTLSFPVRRIDEPLHRLSKGGILDPRGFGEILTTLRGARQLMNFIRKGLESLESDVFEESALFVTFPPPPDQVIEYLGDRFTPSGELSDQASPELSKLRHQYRAEKSRLQEEIQRFFASNSGAKSLQDAVVTERDGRFVLPVKTELKGQVGGVIHGSSSSGSTVYVEPPWLMERNNKLIQLNTDIQREIERILRETSHYVGEHGLRLLEYLTLAGQLDKRLAGARLSVALDASVPHVEKPVHQGGTLRFDVKGVRHPLLILQHGKDNVVPNTMALGEGDIRTLVITGPNTGGKTVLLKTIGLCGLMVRAGLPIPADPGGRISLFNPILADIGDLQSISQSLSTFSASMRRLIHFVEGPVALHQGLILIDEIAAGTDPVEGAALAQTLLDALYDKGALTVVTTHLGVLKMVAHQHPGFMNASVLFDSERLTPTYQLVLGIPGTSNALTIAQRLGLSEKLAEKARLLLGNQASESAAFLSELEDKNRALGEALEKAQKDRQYAEATRQTLESDYQTLRDQKRQILFEYRAGMKSRLHHLEKQVKAIKKQLKNPLGSLEDIKQMSSALQGIISGADTLFSNIEEELMAEDKAAQGGLSDEERFAQIEIGQDVECLRGNFMATVVEKDASHRRLTLQAGILRVVVSMDEIRVPSKEQHTLSSQAKKAMNRAQRVPSSASRRRSDAPTPKEGMSRGQTALLKECDLRGMRVEEGLEALDRFLDEAIARGDEMAAIIHGQGTGAMKKAVRNHLRTLPYIADYYPAEAIDGGDGKTIFVFKV